ncbi:MAG: matrixin family metalloprotease [bacterium]
MKNTLSLVFLLLIAFVVFSCGKQEPIAPEQTGKKSAFTTQSEEGDPAVLAKMHEINEQLAAQGLNMAVESIEFFTIGAGRPSNRIHQQDFRWVANDPNRLAQGIDITYLVDQSMGATASGLTNAQTEAAIDRAMTTWDNEKALKKVDLVKRPDPGSDVTIYDWFFGFGGFGNYLAADIVNAGWWPRAFFEAVGGPGGGRGILAFSVTFIWTSGGVPTDINGDNYLDTALNEVYYNDTFGDPNDDRAGNPWGINIPLPGIDVETVALHENGHSLGIGHFGPPPDAVLNPVYAGIRQSPFPADQAGMEAVWASWPK